MSSQAMYVTLEVMDKDDPAQKQILQHVVETTLAAKAMNGAEEDRAETTREKRNDRGGGIDTRGMHDVWNYEDDVDKIPKDDEGGVQNDAVRMSRLTKKKYKRQVENRRKDKSRILRTANRVEDRREENAKEKGNYGVICDSEVVPKVNSSTLIVKTYNRTGSDEEVAQLLVEQEKTGSAEVHDVHAKTSTYRDELHARDENEVTIVEMRMVNDVLRKDGLVTGRMKVAREVKVEVDYFVELSNEQVHCRRWQR